MLVSSVLYLLGVSLFVVFSFIMAFAGGILLEVAIFSKKSKLIRLFAAITGLVLANVITISVVRYPVMDGNKMGEALLMIAAATLGTVMGAVEHALDQKQEIR